MTAHYSTRASRHLGYRDLCRLVRCLAPSSGIARYDVEVRETAPKSHCGRSTN
jgi:hypothetical protein